MFTDSQLFEIRQFRHEVRLNGCWGGCYEVSAFVEQRFGWRRVDGVFQLGDGTPVFKHSWNTGPAGELLDATADQFMLGGDIDLLALDDSRRSSYRLKYTRALNPAKTGWLSGQPYVGVPDEVYWQQQYEARKLGPGWWLVDNGDYLKWLSAGAEIYFLFQAKLQEYRELGYRVAHDRA